MLKTILEKVNSWILSRWFTRFSFVVLLVCTFSYSLVGGLVHSNNADELIDPFLFKDYNTFHNAQFPGMHSFMLKWPIFWLIARADNRPWAYICAEVGVSLITILGLVWIINKIISNQALRGTLYLLMASILLFVPAQPYANSLLPINMSMLANRNLEYLLLLVAIWLVFSSAKVISRKFLGALVLLTLLFASDRLFVTLLAGGSLLSVIIVFRNSFYKRQILRLVLSVVFATILAQFILKIINYTGLTHLVADSSLSPYNIINNPTDVIKGLVYSILAVLSNLGANPLFDLFNMDYSREILRKRITQAFTIGIIINLFLVFFITKLALSKNRKIETKIQIDIGHLMALIFVSMTIMSLIMFIFINHQYVADARYVAIAFFGFIFVATYCLSKVENQKILPLISSLCVLAIVFGSQSLVYQFKQQDKFNQENNHRNQYIIGALKSRPVDVLVGNYWRVTKLRQTSSQNFNIMSVDKCFDKPNLLDSKAWYKDLNRHNFAFILSLDDQALGGRNCDYATVVQRYGVPNSRLVIAGTEHEPKEVMLFYDSIGKGVVETSDENSSSYSLLPKKPEFFLSKDTHCASVTFNIVAHEDDDILFMNPDLIDQANLGNCMRTVYVTAGDSGNHGKKDPYWVGREVGSQSAYAKMFGFVDSWIQDSLVLGNGNIIGYAQPKDVLYAKKVSLLYMRLPDGNIDGRGFRANNWQSLQKIFDNPGSIISSVDDESKYNQQDLIDSLSLIMNLSGANIINTQTLHEFKERDHSDHIAVARIANQAYLKYSSKHLISSMNINYYLGYPVASRPENVIGEKLNKKQEIFMQYAMHDGAVCHKMGDCYKKGVVYGKYLSRQYKDN